MTYVLRLLFTYLLGLLSLTLSAQELSYHHFTTDDGLPSSEVYDVYQDSKGYIWMASDHGLVKYDGYNFKTFNTNNGLPDNTIFKIKEDNKGFLWVQTFSKGLFSFDGEKFSSHPQNNWILQNSVMKAVYSYDFIGDTLLITNLISIYGCSNNDTFVFGRYTKPYTVEKMPLHLQYFKLPTGKFMYTLAEETIAPFGHLPGCQYGEALINHPGKDNAITGLIFLSDTTNAAYINNCVYLVTAGLLVPEELYCFDHRINCMYQSSDKKLWIGLNKGGLAAFEQVNGKYILQNRYFNDYSISSILEDREHNYWLTTLEDGTFFVPGINFQRISLGSSHNAIPTKAMSLLAYDNSIYIGTDKSALLKLDKLNEVKTFPYKGRQERIEDIIEINNQIEPTAYFENITYECACGTAPLSLAKLPGSNKVAIGGHRGFAIIQDKKVIKCSTTEGFNARVPIVYYDSIYQLLMGTNIGLYQLKNDSLSYFFSDSLLNNIRVTDIKPVPSGGIVITTRGEGLFYINGNKRINITEKENLISNLIEKVYVENDSSFWIATYSGLSHLTVNFSRQPIKPIIENYTKREGLSSNEINDIEMFGGEVWLATNNGLCHFKPRLVKKVSSSFPLYLTSVVINGVARSKEDLANLKSNENNLVFELTGLNYKSLGSINYHYVLEGRSRFEGVSKTRRISFIGLEPGDYQIRVTAIAATGDTSLRAITLNFSIPPYFTRTWWFIGLIVLAILVGVLSIVYLYYQNLTIKNETRTQVIEAEQAALRSQMNPHFIFNVLNSIQSFLGENDKKQAQNFLGKFSQLVRRTLHNSQFMFITLEEEIRSLHIYLQLEQMRFESKISYSIDTAPGVIPAKLLVPPMMIQPLIENSILHGITPSGKNGVIKIAFRVKNNMLHCSVTDNGIGLKAAASSNHDGHQSTAIQNLRKRLDLLNRLYKTNATLEITEIYDSGVTQGTTALLIFPLQY